MKLIYWLSLILAVTLVSTVADAGERYTSLSPVDSSCAVDVPVGATVEPATGRVTLADGSSYTAPPCAVSWAPGRHSAFVGTGANAFGRVYGLSTGYWAMGATAQAISHGGEAAFDNIEQYLYVPDEPAIAYEPGDPAGAGRGPEAMQSISCGLENVLPDGEWLTIMQAEIVWRGTHQPGSTSGWMIQTQYVLNVNFILPVTTTTSPHAPRWTASLG